MAEPITTIGCKLSGREQRDAIHIAIMPVICGEDYMRPGEEVGLVYGTKNTVKYKASVYGLDSIGVIDPFLRGDSVRKGDVVWCFLKPGTIAGLRHEWTHPDIDNQKPPKNDSEKWLRQFADKWNFDYDVMVGVASQGSIKETFNIPGIETSETYDVDFITAMGRDLHSREELGDDYELFWQHMEMMTGQKFSAEHREKVRWSCSC
jgi:hypothetical protein